MADRSRDFSLSLALGLLAIVVAAVILAGAYLPVAECRRCVGSGKLISFFKIHRGREIDCDECDGVGKVSLLTKWKQDSRYGRPFRPDSATDPDLFRQ